MLMLRTTKLHLLILSLVSVVSETQIFNHSFPLNGLSPDDVLFISEVVRQELQDCNLFVLYGNEFRLQQFTAIFSSTQRGVTLIDMKEADDHYFLESKNLLLREDPKICINYLVLYEKKFLNKLMDVEELFWVSERKIFIVAIDRSDRKTMEELLYQPVFRKSSQLFYALGQTRPSFWNLFTLTLYTGEKRQDIKRTNSWSPNRGFSYDKPLFHSVTLQDFAGYDFTVAALPYSPFVIERDLSVNGPKRYRGLEINLLDAVAKYANFTYHYTSPDDRQWGKQLKDGTWTGMIGMVAREEADFAISDIAPSVHRLKVVDFCDIFVFDASELITPRALPLPLWQGPIRPFAGEVWAAIVITLFASSLFIYAISYVPSINTDDKWFRSFSNCFIYAMLPLFMRCSKMDYQGTSGRLFISLWLALAMIISISYTSSLTSFLIMPGYTKPIENLEQLVTSEIGWAKVDFGGLQNEMLEKATDPTLKALGRGVTWRNDLDGILKDVVKGEIATWENSITTHLKVAVHYSDKNGQPLVYFTGYALLQERISWPIQKYAPFKRRFNVLTNRVVESGLIGKFFEDIILEEQRRQKSKISKNENTEDSDSQIVLTIDHIQGPFYLILVGYVVAFATFIVEIIVKKITK